MGFGSGESWVSSISYDSFTSLTQAATRIQIQDGRYQHFSWEIYYSIMQTLSSLLVRSANELDLTVCPRLLDSEDWEVCKECSRWTTQAFRQGARSFTSTAIIYLSSLPGDACLRPVEIFPGLHRCEQGHVYQILDCFL